MCTIGDLALAYSLAGTRGRWERVRLAPTRGARAPYRRKPRAWLQNAQGAAVSRPVGFRHPSHTPLGDGKGVSGRLTLRT